ncbi:MAG TPA: hypothetical protein VFM96_15560 [Gaiellaceae bacterium]|nr:hypothetical protein [Gaiellaceae bacterium]
MKTLLAVTVAALAISVPVALGDTPPPPSIQTNPSGQTQDQGQNQNQGQNQGQGGAADRIQRIGERLTLIEKRFDKRCGTDSSKASQQCTDFAKKAEDRLGTIDTKLQALITKRQQAGKDVGPLTTLDTAVQALAQKLHAWLGS